MSNLGGYQLLTTWAKRLGGPSNLVGFIFVAGGVTAAGGIAIANKIIKDLDEKKQQEASAVVYTVTADGKSNEGLVFQIGEEFKVLEVDGDAALIEKLGDTNNPYFVSATLLREISNYK